MPEDFRHTYIPVLIKHFTDKRLFYLLSKKGLNKVQDAVNHLTSLIDLGGVILVDEQVVNSVMQIDNISSLNGYFHGYSFEMI